MRDPRRLARLCKVLSVDTRIRILELLRRRTLCVNALAQRLAVTPAAISQHLRILRDAGLVVSEKRGYYVHYRIDRKGLEVWRRMVRDALQGEARESAGGNASRSGSADEEEGGKPCVVKRRTAGNPRS